MPGIFHYDFHNNARDISLRFSLYCPGYFIAIFIILPGIFHKIHVLIILIFIFWLSKCNIYKEKKFYLKSKMSSIFSSSVSDQLSPPSNSRSSSSSSDVEPISVTT